MSIKGTNTTADYLEFDRTLNLSLKELSNGKYYKVAFFIIVGIYTGLRISDILRLKYKDFDSDTIEIIEQKTKKKRIITINQNVKDAYKKLLQRLKTHSNRNLNDDFVFTSQKSTVYKARSINRILKVLLQNKKNKDLHISSHSLRKTFGRRVWEQNQESEKALIYLSDIFNHSNTGITRRYLGIRKQEIADIYINL